MNQPFLLPKKVYGVENLETNQSPVSWILLARLWLNFLGFKLCM